MHTTGCAHQGACMHMPIRNNKHANSGVLGARILQPAAFEIPDDAIKAITTANVKESDLAKNHYKRQHITILSIMDQQIEDMSHRTSKKTLKIQKARFLSAGGKFASGWLSTGPRLARGTMVPLHFPSHLFKIALKLRANSEQDPEYTGGKCICNCKDNQRDLYGYHLSNCPWGGLRIERHDRVNEILMQWARAAGCKTLSQNHKDLRRIFPSAAKYSDNGKILTKRTIVIPDATTCDNRNVTTAYDVKITAPKAQDWQRPRSAAARGEKQKQKHYDQHKQKCRSQGMTDGRLNIEVIPIVFESPGAAGRHMIDLAHRLSRHFEDMCLFAASKSDITLFNTKWSHRISTQLQIYATPE